MNHSDSPEPAPGADPFVHVPHLRGRFVAPEDSKVRVTPEILAQWDENAIARGDGLTWRLPDEEREASRRAFLQGVDTREGLWFFGYGSLMWDPAVYFKEVRAAELDGYQRRFNYVVNGGRGTPECPGLVLSLVAAPGQCCQGLAFWLAPEAVEHETTLLWRREMVRGGYAPTLLPLRTPQGPAQALVFVAHDANPHYVHDLSLAQTAEIVAKAEGHLGRNCDYLFQLAEQLRAMAISDDYIDDLVARVRAL